MGSQDPTGSVDADPHAGVRFFGVKAFGDITRQSYGEAGTPVSAPLFEIISIFAGIRRFRKRMPPLVSTMESPGMRILKPSAPIRIF
jgi:hypothetical protein